MNQRSLSSGECVMVEDLASRIIRYAARITPAILTERLREEWLADLTVQSGPIARLRFALGCVWAAMTIHHQHVATGTSANNAARPLDTAHVMAARAYHGPPLYPGRTAGTTSTSLTMCDINITPLIDVMLVLLVTLIMTLPVMTHAVRINMSSARAAAPVPLPEVINLDIDFDGTLVWNGIELQGLAQLETYLQSAALKNPQPEIHLRPDPHVKYDFVAKVLAASQRNRMVKIGFANTAAFQE
jgi:biopolymer transport protein ExbD